MATAFSEDPVNNAILNGIKRDIEVCWEHKCNRATPILILCGIDAMAFLNMPDTQIDVTRTDFIGWADRYIQMPGLTGDDLYGARCAMLHTYSAFSRYSREGNCRVVGWVIGGPPVVFDRGVDPNLVCVEVGALKDAFFAGVFRFLIDRQRDAGRLAIFEQRLQKLTIEIPFKKDNG